MSSAWARETPTPFVEGLRWSKAVNKSIAPELIFLCPCSLVLLPRLGLGLQKTQSFPSVFTTSPQTEGRPGSEEFVALLCSASPSVTQKVRFMQCSTTDRI